MWSESSEEEEEEGRSEIIILEPGLEGTVYFSSDSESSEEGKVHPLSSGSSSDSEEEESVSSYDTDHDSEHWDYDDHVFLEYREGGQRHFNIEEGEGEEEDIGS
jgi:hypothetical protein